jgi:hypothetical protein
VGTSQSSGGPASGVPMVPSWVPDLPAINLLSAGEALTSSGDQAEVATPSPAPSAPPSRIAQIAPPARFLSARRSLGEFARTGDIRDMRRGVRHYVRTGYGGSATAARRFGGTAATAGTLYDALSKVASGQIAAPGSPLDPVLLAGRSVQEVIDAVIEAARPIDGTQDAEAERSAIRDALSELLTRFPEADLLNLNTEERTFAIEHYVAHDVYRRFDLDLGKTILDKAPSAITALSRLKQVRDYVKETVAAAFRKLRDAGRTVNAGRVGQIVRDALRETFQVFEVYIE